MKKLFSIIISLMMANACLTAQASVTSHNMSRNDVKDSIKSITDKAKQGNAAAQNTLGLWYYTGKNVKQDYRTALTWWSKSAEQENADATGNMALCFQLGHGTKKDSVTAIKLYKKAIKKGNKSIIPQHEAIVRNTGSAFSSRLLYDCYNEGIGVKRDTQKAEAYMKRLAETGDVKIMYALALKHLNGKQIQDAARLFKEAAAKGNTGAIYYYGYLMFKGMGVKQDKANGIKLMQKAADKGFNAACHQLGTVYYEGDGVEKDLNKALTYLKKAAATNKDAAWLTALCYINGTPQDLYFATQWMAEAARSHEKDFNRLMADNKDRALYSYILGLKKYYTDKDYDAALKLFKTTAKMKSAEGMTMQAVCMANKAYEKRNPKKAVKTLEKAIKEGSVMALYCLASLYENGEGTEQDKARALDLLRKAADGGIGYAQCKLGDMYFTGEGTTQDYVQAAKYYLAAEAQNQLTPASAMKLAVCYERGISSLPDVNNAKQRIAKLKSTKVNDNLINMLKAIKEQAT